jgi:hypothetical protein
MYNKVYHVQCALCHQAYCIIRLRMEQKALTYGEQF